MNKDIVKPGNDFSVEDDLQEAYRDAFFYESYKATDQILKKAEMEIDFNKSHFETNNEQRSNCCTGCAFKNHQFRCEIVNKKFGDCLGWIWVEKKAGE